MDIIETGANLGFAGGCNAGIRKALNDGARHVWLLNNDTVVEPRTLSALVRRAESTPSAGAASSVVYAMAPPHKVQVHGGGRFNAWTGRCQAFKKHGRPDYLSGASLLLRREALLDVGLLDEQSFFLYWEDVDLSLRLAAAGWSLAVAEDSRVYHQGSASVGEGSCLQDFYFSQSSVRFFRKHYTCWIWPVAVNTITRVAKRLSTGRWSNTKAVFAGTLAGLGRPPGRDE